MSTTSNRSFNRATKKSTSTPKSIRRNSKSASIRNKNGTMSIMEECNSNTNIMQDVGNRRFAKNRSSLKEMGTIRKTPRRVCFSPSVNKGKKGCCSNEYAVDTSMMGYDWIAHMVDNESVLHDQSDDYFEQIENFRKDNWEQCIVTQNDQNNYKDQKTEMRKLKAENMVLKEDKKNRLPLCCTGNGAYTLDRRCDLIPIHGPYSDCPICHCKPKFGENYENKCVRVTIPKRALESPYQIRPHRRKSFDPAESLSLSSHCLAGWTSKKQNGIKISDQHIGLSSETSTRNTKKRN